MIDPESQEVEAPDGVAIIGMAGRFPGASSLDQFWRNLCDGVESVVRFTDEQLIAAGEDPALLNSPDYVKAGILLDDIDVFDAEFFGFTTKEAQATDPQHRIFLECAWEAIENAGYDAARYSGKIGVFGGCGILSSYPDYVKASPQFRLLGDLQTSIAHEKDFLTTRVAYRLNLRGPAMTVQTACSTSLVAVHMGCQSLLNGDSDMVLAGGVGIRIPNGIGHLYRPGSILSIDGHCRAFDAAASGTLFGSGAGIVVLKRYADAVADGDNILAVIRGSCVNNDGAAKVAYTAPSVDGQAAAIAEAQAIAGVSAADVSYVETHGTATTLGDTIEIAALTRAFRETTDDNGFCGIGSIKPNIGHLDAAAGIAGLIKVTMALNARVLPPSVNFETPNPAIDFAASPFYVQKSRTPWNPIGGKRIAGVSSFGIGGTNAHVVVEESPIAAEPRPASPWQPLVLSARTANGLDAATENLAAHLEQHPDLNLEDVSWTLLEGRKVFDHRRVLTARDAADAVTLLRSRDPKRVLTGAPLDAAPTIVFMFPGQAAQYVNMGRELYETESIFREHVDRCAEGLKPWLDLDIRTLLYPRGGDLEEFSEQLRQTRFTQPALFTIEYALAQLWMSWGITPAAMVGHSLGEFVAATLSGVFSLSDALMLVAKRGRMMQELPSGAMLAVHLSEEELRPHLESDVSLAAINGPHLTVAAGTHEAIERLAERLRSLQVRVQLLRTSHAFHSMMMDPIETPFIDLVSRTRRSRPRIAYVSTVTGTWVTPDEAMDPHYWARLNRNAVRFSPAVDELLKKPGRVMIEAGPGNTLSTLVRLRATQKTPCAVVSSLRSASEIRADRETMLTALSQLWMAGFPVDWSCIRSSKSARRVPLPTYPFERRRFWIDPPQRHPSDAAPPESDVDPASSAAVPGQVQSVAASLSDMEESMRKVWRDLLGGEVGLDDNFFDLGGHSLAAVALLGEIDRVFGQRFSHDALMNAPTVRAFSALVMAQSQSTRSDTEHTPQTIADALRKFLTDNGFLTSADLALDDSLLDRGVVDETNLLLLVEFIEENYGLNVGDEDLVSSNFHSIGSISQYVLTQVNSGVLSAA